MKKESYLYFGGFWRQKKRLRIFVPEVMLLCMVLFTPFSVFSQNQMVTITLSDADIDAVFKSIKVQTGLNFMYNVDKIKKINPVSLNVNNVTVDSVLNLLLAGSSFVFAYKENTIVISGKETGSTRGKADFSGKVTDRQGNPLAGVAVFLKGTTVGTTTNTNGFFEFPATTTDRAVLCFSFIGMKKVEQLVVVDRPVVIQLEEDVQEMEEVVVTGYQTLKKRDVTGSVTTIKASDIMMPAYTSIDQMLQGRVAGLMVMNTSSRVGTSPKIRIRGTSTILGNRDPLWVVDGIIQPDPLPMDQSDAMVDDLKNIIGNQVSWLNPADIETITVLKDASATAIYGSKAANGVIVITTKKGRSDHMTVNYSGNLSFRTRPKYNQFNLMDSHERIQFSKDAFMFGATYMPEPSESMDTYEGVMRLYMARKITKEAAEQQIQKLESANTDWLKILTRNALSHNHNLSISGGSSKITYNASMGYGDNAGVEQGNEASNLSGRLHLGVTLHPKVQVDLNLAGSINENKGYAADVNPLNYATTTSRSVLAYDDDGSKHFLKRKALYELHNFESFFNYNILNEIENSYSKSRSTRLDGTLNFKWQILPWLSYEFMGGINDNINLSESYAGENTFYVTSKYRGYDVGTAANASELFKAAMLPFGGKLYNSNTGTSGWNVQNKLLFSKTFAEIHRLNAIVGTEVSSALTKTAASTIWGYLPERGEGIVQPTPLEDLVPIGDRYPGDWGVFDELYNGAWRHTTQTTRMFSLFATLAYSLNDRYVFNASIRNDISNRFGQDQNKRFDPTYSVGLSWDVASENWMENISGVLNQFNIRATYGVQGNSLSSVSPDVILREGGVKLTYNEFKVNLSSLPNPNLSWERTKSWNLGVDIQLFKWITMNVEYYGKRSNVITNQEIGVEYGLRTMLINGGRVTNEGVEYTLNMTPVQTKDWAWTIGLNSSKNWNKMGSKPIDGITLDNYLQGTPSKVLKKGYPLSAFWSYSYKGLNPENGLPEFNLLDVEEDEFSGDYSDLLVYSGQSEPDFTGGLTTRLRWKGFTLGMDFALVLGAKKRLPNPYPHQGHIPDSHTNLDRDLLKCWKNPGDEKSTDFPALYRGSMSSDVPVPHIGTLDGIDVWSNSDIRVANASFLRCQQLSLNWKVSTNWCEKIGMKNLTVNATLNNVFVICSKKFNGFDPELDNSVQPKIFSFGVNIGL